jgi:hypothetical protein
MYIKSFAVTVLKPNSMFFQTKTFPSESHSLCQRRGENWVLIKELEIDMRFSEDEDDIFITVCWIEVVQYKWLDVPTVL